MNINRKYIIIFGTLILLLVVVTGVITYNKEKVSQESLLMSKDRLILQKGRYISTAVNYSDLLKENTDLGLFEGDNFNLCTIIKPALIEIELPSDQLFEDPINIDHSIIFQEGEILCRKFFSFPPKTLNIVVSGFIPEKTDVFQAKIYFIPEDATVNNLLSQESFANIENILQSYPVLWSIEKPII